MQIGPKVIRLIWFKLNVLCISSIMDFGFFWFFLSSTQILLTAEFTWKILIPNPNCDHRYLFWQQSLLISFNYVRFLYVVQSSTSCGLVVWYLFQHLLDWTNGLSSEIVALFLLDQYSVYRICYDIRRVSLARVHNWWCNRHLLKVCRAQHDHLYTYSPGWPSHLN